MKDHIEILRLLKADVDTAIAIADAGNIKSITDHEAEAYKRIFGDFDMIIGHFGIIDLSDRNPLGDVITVMQKFATREMLKRLDEPEECQKLKQMGWDTEALKEKCLDALPKQGPSSHFI